MEWMTATEASERWGLAESTIRVAIRRGQFDDQIERGLVRKSGKVWLLTDVAMTEVYGPEKKVAINQKRMEESQ